MCVREKLKFVGFFSFSFPMFGFPFEQWALRKDFQCPPPLKGIQARHCNAKWLRRVPSRLLSDSFLLKVADLLAHNLTPAINPPPTYKGYILDQTPNQLHSKEFIIRIFYQDYSSLIITCDSVEMIQQRIQNTFNINNKVRFTNHNPNIENHTFSTTKNGKDDITVYYSATLEFEFTKAWTLQTMTWPLRN